MYKPTRKIAAEIEMGVILATILICMVVMNLEIFQYNRDNKKIKELFRLQLELDTYLLEEMTLLKENNGD